MHTAQVSSGDAPGLNTAAHDRAIVELAQGDFLQASDAEEGIDVLGEVTSMSPLVDDPLLDAVVLGRTL